jgi:hypothetical protein
MSRVKDYAQQETSMKQEENRAELGQLLDPEDGRDIFLRNVG